MDHITRMGPGPHSRRGNFDGERGRPGHVRTCPAVDIPKATKQGATPVRCGCRLGCTRFGAHWRHLANTIGPSVRGCDMASCQNTLTTSFMFVFFYLTQFHGLNADTSGDT